MKISIILPAYNEEDRLPSCLDELLDFLPSQGMEYEIIVSTDGCTDNTQKIAMEYQAKNPNIILVSFPERLGKGGGVLNAARSANGDILIVMDVDLAVPPTQIPITIKKMEEERADIIYGSRNLPESVILINPPFYRKFLGNAFNFFFRLLFGIDLHDTQCGFKAVRKEVFDSLQRDLNIEGFAYDIDLAVKADRHGYKIVEMPVTWSHGSGSKVNVFKQMVEMGRDLLIAWFEGKKKEATTKNLARFYDTVPSDVYSKASESWFLPRRWWHRRKNATILHSVPHESIYVLDAGFGSGTLFDGLQEGGRHVFGVDIGGDFVGVVHSKFGDSVRILQSDVSMIPFRDSVMDCVVCSEVLEHVEDPARTLGEIYRILKPGGATFITTPHISLRWAITEALRTHVRREIIETEHVAFTRRRLRYYLVMIGFNVIEDREILLGCLNFVVAKKIT